MDTYCNWQLVAACESCWEAHLAEQSLPCVFNKMEAHVQSELKNGLMEYLIFHQQKPRWF
jgi:hypothetical protein